MIPVRKAHAYGNDFLYVRASAIETAGVDAVSLAVRICDRHTGLGADGLIVFSETADGASMRLTNSDGSPSEVSGNGVRGLAALLARDREWHRPPLDDRVLVIDTDAGPKRLHLLDADGTCRFAFRADMGRPRDIRTVELDVAGERVTATCLDIGNPQCVVLDRLEPGRWERIGRALQSHPAFPQAVNFELAEVAGRALVRILIWERGAGPTRSSGTGSCAAAIAAMAAGLVDRAIDVESPGGTQRVEWTDGPVLLTGWAEVVFEGQWVVDADVSGSLSGR